MKRVFLSHGNDAEARELVAYIRDKLRNAGVTVISDREMGAYMDVSHFVQDAIKQCSAVIALLTAPSEAVLYTIGYAEGIGKRVIILRSTDVRPHPDLRTLQMLTVDRDDPTFISKLRDLLEESAPDEDTSNLQLQQDPSSIFALYREYKGSFERIDNATFERAVAGLFVRQGFELETQRPASAASFDFAVRGFEGADRVIVEVKKYSANSKISVGQVQQLLGAVVAEHADFGVIISPSEYTATAVEFATHCNPRVELWNIEELERRLTA